MRGTTRERAVALDVRVDAVVDEARVALLAVAVLADLRDEVREPRLARAAVAAGAARAGQLARPTRGRARARPPASSSRVWLAARAQVRGLLGRAAALERQQLLDQRLARPAAGAGARRRHDLLRRAEPVARGSPRRSRPCRRRCSCRPARCRAGRRRSPRPPAREQRERRRAPPRRVRDRLEQQLVAARVAEQDGAGGAAVAVDDELAVRRRRVGGDDLARPLRVADRRRGRRPSP